ncbi:MAG: ATP-binding cassette domain-containing protein [Spirochaetaceae bacterium]|jgi:ABC-2 type transport system ATP-binding protein|nr:ATP-binding cassette domain-containing protein [Spirochaetaceae bacterium]
MIEVQGLTKRYGVFEAVKDVSFAVGTEQVLGFLGPNGAGKTTVMKILTGYHFPTAGTARINGVSVQEDPVAVKKQLGYLPESVPLYGDLTVEEYLSFIADARAIPVKKRKSAIQTACHACGLEHVAGKRIETLSKGYKQRTGLAQAILHDPQILILDEPTTGLDPNQIIEIRSLIKELGKRKTVILSTHILQEVEAVCSQVLILNEGRIAAQGSPEAIAGTLKGTDTWELILKGSSPEGIREKLARLGGIQPDFLETASEYETASGDGERGAANLRFSVPAGALTGERIFDWAVQEGLKIIGMNRKKLSLEDIFVKLTGGGEEESL